MTRKHFTIFVEVCRFLNFSQAAEALNTTQPAVSLAVKELESHYSVALFERMNRRVYLTPAGEALLATAQDVLRGFQEAEETLGQGRPLALRVGANVSFGEAGLAQVLGRFRQEHPQVRLRALVANSDKIQSLLAENQLDVGIVDGLGVSERLRAQPLYQEDLVLAAAPGRFPAPATVEELAALPLLLREPGSGLRSSVDRVFSQQGLAPQPLLESTSTAGGPGPKGERPPSGGRAGGAVFPAVRLRAPPAEGALPGAGGLPRPAAGPDGSKNGPPFPLKESPFSLALRRGGHQRPGVGEEGFPGGCVREDDGHHLTHRDHRPRKALGHLADVQRLGKVGDGKGGLQGPIRVGRAVLPVGLGAE